MSEIKVGAEVTLTGKVLEIVERYEDEHRYRVALSGGLILWLPENVFSTVKNPAHPEPESGFALLNDQIAWKTPNGGWETDSGVFRDWAHLLEIDSPTEIVELVRKAAS